ncbi:MAG: 50S ribosomal protein L9 [Candidatus Magasanikbacteria bacterium]|nr:50S ribosomal protein L9 [Candidatus Magasanikbacteria bacterium]|tara:strand:+ start:7129 stop:7572 length:444 start_codon:yes stop_codon:yes gene_type:complete
MRVILTQSVKGTGSKGDVVTVSDGYAINFLIKKGLAKTASAAVVTHLSQKEQKVQKIKREKSKESKKILTQLKGKSITIKESANEQGTLYAAITPKKIVDTISTQLGVKVLESAVTFPHPIKSTGTHSVKITLLEQIQCRVTCVVLA